LNSVEELLADLRAGRMVILMDDEGRENEGDLLMAASLVRPEDINFMARYGRGLICLTLARERCRTAAAAADGQRDRPRTPHQLHAVDRGRRGRDHRHLGLRPCAHGPHRGAAGRAAPRTCASRDTSSR
jgi:hypothetical protein